MKEKVYILRCLSIAFVLGFVQRNLCHVKKNGVGLSVASDDGGNNTLSHFRQRLAVVLQDSQNEAAVHCADGYITVMKLPDWSREFYRDISTRITHGSFVLRIYLTVESFRTRLRHRHAIVRTPCMRSVIVVIYVICVKRPHQFLRTVGILRETGPAYLQM